MDTKSSTYIPESDHAPISFHINCSNMTYPGNKAHYNVYSSYKWANKDRDAYKERVDDQTCKYLKDQIVELSASANTDVNILVDAYYDYLDHASVRPKKTRGSSSSKFPKNTWYNDECRSIRRKVKDFSKMHDLSLELNRVTYFKLKRDYRRVIQRTKRKAKEKKNQTGKPGS